MQDNKRNATRQDYDGAKGLRFLTLLICIVSFLASLRLIEGDQLPSIGLTFVGVGCLILVIAYDYWRWLWQVYHRFLSLIGQHITLQLFWLLVVCLGWWLMPQVAPRLMLDLFPAWIAYSILFLLLIGLASPQAFTPLAKLYGGIVFGLGFALLLLEVFLRLYTFPPQSSIGAQLALFDVYISDEHIGHALKPNSNFFWTNAQGEFTIDVHINELGLRDVARAYDNPDDTPRLLVLGDSFTEALQVESAQTPTQVAERCLHDHYEQAIEVINGGLSANGTAQRLLYYEHYGHRFNADAVILALYPSNDLWDNRGNLGEFANLRGVYAFDTTANGELSKHYTPPQRDLTDYLSDSLGLKTFAVIRAIGFNNQQVDLDRRLYFDQALYSADFPETVPQEWAIHRALVRQMAQMVEEDNASFGMIIIPNWRAVEQSDVNSQTSNLDFDVLHKAIQADAEAANIPATDLLPLARATDEPLYWEHDGHFNEVGYQLMGETLCQMIIDQDMLGLD